MDGPVGIASPCSTWTVDAAYAYATKRAIPPTDPGGEPLYNCPWSHCSKQFSKRFNLKAHLRVHTGDTPFVCNFQGCTRRFKWKSSLTSHQAGHSKRRLEVQKRNALMAGKALAAESVQNPANTNLPASSTTQPFSHYSHKYHPPQHHHHAYNHHSQPQSQQTPPTPTPTPPPPPPPQQQQQQQSPQYPSSYQHPQNPSPPQTATPSVRPSHVQQHPQQPLRHHPTLMYGTSPSHQPSAPSHHHRNTSVSHHPTQSSSSASFPHHRTPESVPSLSYITADDPYPSPRSSHPSAPQSYPKPNIQQHPQEKQHLVTNTPHQSKLQKRRSDPFLDSYQQQERSQPAKQPRHNASTSVQRSPPQILDPPSSQKTSFASQRSFNQEPISNVYAGTQQTPQQQGQQQHSTQPPHPQFVSHPRDDNKALAAQHADHQKRLQDERQQLERQEEQLREQQRLLRQKQKHNKEEQRRLQQLREQQERGGHTVEEKKADPTSAAASPLPQSGTVRAGDSLTGNRAAGTPQEHRQEGNAPLQRVEDTSRGLPPIPRPSLPSLAPVLPPLNGTAQSEGGSQLKSDPPTSLPKSSQAALASPASLGLATGSILPSPTASLGMTRSPNCFSQRFLYPGHSTSPTWATTPTAPGVSITLASPKPVGTPNGLMDVQMTSLNSEPHAGDMSPVPSEVAISPGIHSPMPQPMLPQVSSSRPRRPLNHAKPPLGGPSLSSGPSAMLPPLSNVVPANPPTHIDLRGVMDDEGPNCSLPALGSPHTDMSPLPVASPIFGGGHTPLSPLQPFSPFSGMYASSARGKQTPTW